MGKSLYLESVAGVAGDMFAAAFVDAGLVGVDELNTLSAKLGLGHIEIEATEVIRASVRATHIRVKTGDNGSGHTETHIAVDHHSHTHFSVVDALIGNSSLDEPVKSFARKVFRLLAEAEADAHGIDVEKVAFHEVGTHDSIMDVVMAAYCIVKTDAAKVFATPIKPGRGLVTMQHGTHPVPPPASIRLLTGLPIAATPDSITRENVELSTPTGIAILKVLAPKFVGELPSGTLTKQGMGAGTMDLGNYPNVFRVSLIETESLVIDLPYETDNVIEIVCNIDDDTGEHLAWMSEQLMEKGALDVWQTAATGKKGRVLVCLSVLANEDLWTEFADWILRNGTTLGVRYHKWDRLKLARKFEIRESGGRSISYKLGATTDGEHLKEKAEHDDLIRS